MKKVRFSLLFSSILLLSSLCVNYKNVEPIKTSATSSSNEIVSLYSDDFSEAGEFKNIVATISNSDYTSDHMLTDISSKTNANQKIKFYDVSHQLITGIENNVIYIWDNGQVLFQFHYNDFSTIKMVTFEEGLYLPSQQLADTGAGENYVLDKTYTFINKDYNKHNWFQCTETGVETSTSLTKVDVWENKNGDNLVGYNVCFTLSNYDHSPNEFNTNAYDYLTTVADALSYYDENGDVMNDVTYNTELYVCSFGAHILIQVVTSNPVYRFKLSNEARFPSYEMCTTGRGHYYRMKFDAFILRNENGQYDLLQSNDNNIETSIMTINSLTNDSITIQFNDTDYQFIDSSSIVGQRKDEYDYLDKTLITSKNKTYVLREILNDRKNFYFNYQGHMNSYTFCIIIDTSTITRITFKSDTSFPKYSYTGANTNEVVADGESNIKSSIIISEVCYVKYGDSFIKNQISNLAVVREIRLGDFAENNHFWIYLNNTDYPENTTANIDVNSKCLSLNTYDKIKVDGKTLNEYRLEGKLSEGGFINRFTRWCAFSFSISGITNSSENMAYYADKVEILKGCQFPAYSSDSYYLFDGYLKTTTNVNDTFFASCSMGPVSLKGGDPNGDITERFFVKLSESDYTKTSELTGYQSDNLKAGFAIDNTIFSTNNLVTKIYQNCMGRSDSIGFVFSNDYFYDLKDQDHNINVNHNTYLPAEVDKSTDYVFYYYSPDRDYRFSNLNAISNRQWFDASEVDLFCENYLYMSTYNTSLGYCNDSEHHYYQTAKEIYRQLNDYQKRYFEIVCPDAYARLQGWAIANGETLSSITNQSKISLFRDSATNTTLVVIISFVSISTFSILVYAKKRRHLK